MKMRSRAVILLQATALGWFAMAAGCGLEKGAIYLPDGKITKTPSDVGLFFEDLTLTAEDGVRINAWFVPRGGSRSALLWFHGNAGNLSNRVQSILAFHRNLGVDILMVDYRGYGKSEGRISEEGSYRDAEAAFDYLAGREDLDVNRIVVFGQSLGAAIAVELAGRRPIDGLILEAPFTSIRDMARVTMPWLPFGGLLSIRYDTLSKIRRMDIPLLVTHGDRDTVVPYTQGRRIFDAAPEPKTFYTIPGADHNDTFVVGGEAYFAAIRNFIESLP